MYLLFQSCTFIATVSMPCWLPKVLQKYGVKTYESVAWLPVLAAVLYFSAGYLPDVHISRETTTFQEHFVGGGFYTALLFVYLKRLVGWRLALLISIAVLYAWTSALGVANELFEFTVTKLNITHIDITDTSWDLTANTLGAFVGYALLLLGKIERIKR